MFLHAIAAAILAEIKSLVGTEKHIVEIIAFPEFRNTAGNGDQIPRINGGRARSGKIAGGKRPTDTFGDHR